MNSPDDAQNRVPLSEVKDLIVVGAVLTFRLLDPLERLLLGPGHRIQSESQLEQLLERGAWIEQDAADQLRQARVAVADAEATPIPPAPRRASLFDRWEQKIWDLDALLRKLGRDAALVGELEAFGADLQALVQRDVDVALYMAIRQDDRRFALYALTHALHTATLAALAGQRMGWSQAQLAEVLGIAVQQVQRYESTGYASASLARLADVAAALGIDVSETATLRRTA